MNFDNDGNLTRPVLVDGKLGFLNNINQITPATAEDTLRFVINVQANSYNTNIQKLPQTLFDDPCNVREIQNCKKCKKETLHITTRFGERFKKILGCYECRTITQN
jgi:hypothetical protein